MTNTTDEIIKTYFDNSFLSKAVLEPTKNNIVEKKFIDDMKHGKIEYSHGVNNFDIISINKIKDNVYKYLGQFILFEEKKFKNHDSNTVNFIMVDQGNFEENINVLDSKNLLIITKIDYIRKTVNKDLSTKSIRDNFFKNIPHTSNNGKIQILDIYTIKTRNELLHFTTQSNICEIYSLPDSWNIYFGIKAILNKRLIDISKNNSYYSEIINKDIKTYKKILTKK